MAALKNVHNDDDDDDDDNADNKDDDNNDDDVDVFFLKPSQNFAFLPCHIYTQTTKLYNLFQCLSIHDFLNTFESFIFNTRHQFSL